MFLGSMHAWTARAAGMPRKEARALALVRNEAASCPFCTVFDKPDPDGRRCTGCPLDNPKEMAFPYNCCDGRFVVYDGDPTPANALPVLHYILDKYREWQGKADGEAKPEEPILHRFVKALAEHQLYDWAWGQLRVRPKRIRYSSAACIAQHVLERADAEKPSEPQDDLEQLRERNRTLAADKAELWYELTTLRLERQRTEDKWKDILYELIDAIGAKRGESAREDVQHAKLGVGGLRAERDMYRATVETYRHAGVEASKDSYFQHLQGRNRGLNRKLRGLRKHCKQQAAHHAGKMADTAAEVHRLRTELAAAVELLERPVRVTWGWNADAGWCGYYLDGQWVGPSLEAVVAAAAKGGK